MHHLRILEHVSIQSFFFTIIIDKIILEIVEKLDRCITMHDSIKSSISYLIFLYLRFLSIAFAIHRAAEEGRRPSLCLRSTSTYLQTLIYLFVVIHLECLALPTQSTHVKQGYKTCNKLYENCVVVWEYSTV